LWGEKKKIGMQEENAMKIIESPSQLFVGNYE